MSASDNMYKLCDVAKVTPGLSIPGAIQHSDGAAFQVIIPKHLNKGVDYDFDPEHHQMRMELSERAYKYVIQQGDIVFMARGDYNLATYIMNCPPLCVASGSFYIIRAHIDRVHPRYLSWALNQLPAQNKITTMRTGVGTPFISRADLSHITVRIPRMDEQMRIIEIDSFKQREELLSERLLLLVKQRNRYIAAQIATGKKHIHIEGKQ